jgi:pimeloyl-ACP methyl ester carboxylesterase
MDAPAKRFPGQFLNKGKIEMEAKTGYLQVPGARLYYETRGAGPVLLLIAGGAGDAGSYERITRHLAMDYKVVTYDRRGYARSPLEDPNQLVEIRAHSADVNHLLDAISGAPAAILGCSIGALIGLDLVIRYPEQVHTLIAHEPPIPALLTGAWRLQADQMQKDLLDSIQREGAAAAIRQFAESLGVYREGGTPTVPEGDLYVQAQGARMADYNRAAFFRYEIRAVARYNLDLSALKAASARTLPAGGHDSRGIWPYQCATVFADYLGPELVEFPGDHAGFFNHAKQFAKRLHEILGG